MYTFNWHDAKDRKKQVTFSYHGGFDGNVKIVSTIKLKDHTAGWAIEIPCDALLAFVAEYVRSSRVCELEDMSVDEILGVKR